MRHLALSLASVLIFSVPPACAQTQSEPPASTNASALTDISADLSPEEFHARVIAYFADSANNLRWWGIADRISTIGGLAKIEPHEVFMLAFTHGAPSTALTFGTSRVGILDCPPNDVFASSMISKWEANASLIQTSRRCLIRELAKAVSPKVSDPLFDQLHDTGISGEEAIKTELEKMGRIIPELTSTPLASRPALDAKARAAAALESLHEELRWVLFLQILSQSDRWPWNQMSWGAVTPDLGALAKDLKQELPTLEHAASADTVPDEERLIAAEDWNSNAYNFTKRRLRLLDDTYAKVFQKGPGAWVVKGTPELDALRKPAESDK